MLYSVLLHTHDFPSFYKGEQLLYLSVCLPSKMGFTLHGKNLLPNGKIFLLGDPILSSKELSPIMKGDKPETGRVASAEPVSILLKHTFVMVQLKCCLYFLD